MWIDPKDKLLDPEQYINFVSHQDIASTTSHEDLKNWYRYTNIACLQIETSKLNKSDMEKTRLEKVRTRGVKALNLLGKKLRDLGINPA